MKAYELEINEIGEIAKIIERIAKAEYLKAVERDMVEDFGGRDSLLFLAGWRIGSSIASVEPTHPSLAASVSRSVYELAAGIEVEDRQFEDAYREFDEKLEAWLQEDSEKECDCPKCRAKREAEEE